MRDAILPPNDPLELLNTRSCSWMVLSISLCLKSVTSCLERTSHSAAHHELLVLGKETGSEKNKCFFPSWLWALQITLQIPQLIRSFPSELFVSCWKSWSMLMGNYPAQLPFFLSKNFRHSIFLSPRDAELPFWLRLLGLDIVIITRQVGSPLLQHSQCRTDVSPDHSFYTTASFTSSVILLPGHPHALPPLAAQAHVCPLLSESQRSCRHGGWACTQPGAALCRQWIFSLAHSTFIRVLASSACVLLDCLFLQCLDLNCSPYISSLSYERLRILFSQCLTIMYMVSLIIGL